MSEPTIQELPGGFWLVATGGTRFHGSVEIPVGGTHGCFRTPEEAQEMADAIRTLQTGARAMTDTQAAALLAEGINGLFAAHRDATHDECTAYFERPIGESVCRYVYVAFANGILKKEGYEEAVPTMTDLGTAVVSTVEAVAAYFPDHATQQVVWRLPAEIWRPERAARRGRTFGHAPACPWSTYARIVATPLGV